MNKLLLLLISPCFIYAQILVTGSVSDEYNNPLPYTNVVEIGTSNGVTTDENGRFSISVNLKSKLHFSYTGFQDYMLTTNENTNDIKVILRFQKPLNEITVTARKRVESVQNVPLSIAIMGNLETSTLLAGSADITTLAGRSPGLNVESSNGRVAPRFYLRGLGNTDFDVAASQPVSVIMDNIVLENAVLKSFPIFDLRQVEILRGPQGTFYGKNTIAGVIKFGINKPISQKNHYFNTSYGTFNHVSMPRMADLKVSINVK